MSHELGINGDDATEFLLAYAEHFHVDISQFMAADYFDGEGLDILGFVLSLLRVKSASPRRKKLTVGDLQKGIIAKQLNEHVIHGT